ncbi:hypothetical protein JCM10908_007329 [Rhodotorula pacifica]|uniref:uncharacterized protein n=1 Tax=Rhodotorula pacifica TaxID=1495444 RepID=UPI00316EFBDD
MEIDQASPNAAHSPVDAAAAASVASAATPAAVRSTVAEEEAPLVTVTHRCTVNAIHRLWCPALSEQQNQSRWGLPGMAVHGHKYDFEIKFKAPVSRKTGQVVGAGILEDAVHMGVHEVLNHKNLDTEVSFFISRPSTLENVCLFAWRNIGVIIAHTPRQVYEVSVEAEPCPRPNALSVEKTRVTFSGEMGPMSF